MTNKNNYFHNTVDELSRNICRTTCRNPLRILQLNIRGMNNLDKFDDLKLLLTRYPGTIDVLVIGETWVKNERKNLYNIEGYKSIFSCRPDSLGGGVAVFIKETIRFNEILVEHTDGYHHVHVRLNVGSHFNIHAIYRPPSLEPLVFMPKLEAILAESNRNASCVIVGDINIPVNQTSNKLSEDYLNLLACYNFSITNSYATRPASNNVLDHVVCSESLFSSVVNETTSTELSDHSMILSTFNLQKTVTKILLEKTITNYVKLNEAYHIALRNLPEGSPEEKLIYAIDKYQLLKAQYSKTVSVVANIKGYCPWMTLDLWKLSKMKDNVLSNSKKRPNDNHLKELLEYVSKLLQTEKQRAKRAYHSKLLSSGNQREIWRNVNSIIGRNVRDTNSISLSINGQQTSHGPTISNYFNNFFSTIGPQLASTIISERNVNKFNTLSPFRNSIFLQPTTEQEVVLKIKNLDTNKSQGSDGISAAVIKVHYAAFSTLLREVFNNCINTGNFPDCLKVARVIPIFKSGERTDVSNYRPISILSTLSKILEQLLVDRLTDFLKQSNTLYNRQYGFRSGSNTLTAASEFTNDIYSALDSKKRMGVLFLDLRKAFDTIDHTILVQKLEYYGIRGTANALIRSYLSSREQFVHVNGATSDKCGLQVGVPQGSNLGPLLFLLYVNDLPKLPLHGKPHMYADDTALSYEAIDPEDMISKMQQDLCTLKAYFDENLLSLNLSKTKYMIFHSPRLGLPQHSELIFNATQIDKVDNYKYLGLILDPNLKWTFHIEALQKEISSTCGLLWKIHKFVPSKRMIEMYHAFVQSKLQYLVAIWGAAAKTTLTTLQVVQKRCLKAVYKKPRLYPSVRLFEEAAPAILPIPALRNLQCATQIHNLMRNPNAHHNQPILQLQHRYAVRRQDDLQIHKPKTELGKQAFSYFAKSTFNALPAALKSETNTYKFKTAVKKHLRENLRAYV